MADAAKYRVMPGTFKVAPTKDGFSTDEDVVLNIKCQVQRWRSQSSSPTWYIDYKVYNRSWELIREFSRTKLALPFTEYDTETEDFNASLGRFTAGPLLGYVQISAHSTT